MCVVLLEMTLFMKLQHMRKPVISKGSELGADVQLQDNPSYGIVGCCYSH